MLSKNNVSLCVPTKEDAQKWYEWVNNIETQSYLGSMYGKIITLESELDYYDFFRKKEDLRTFSIYLNQEKKVIGNISLMWIDFQNRKAEMWIAILDKNSRGKWYGTDAVKLIVEFGFRVLGLNKINLRVIWFNDRAKAVYEKVWFKEVWRLREESFRNGKFHDDIYMEIFARDFIK